jgi:pimeloyl-ACP methyl ester carboxylesterase
MATVRAGEFEAWFDDAGETGRPVLFVHGSGLAGASWQRTIAAFDPQRRRRVVDLIGYGRSTPAPRGSPVTADDDLAILLEATRDLAAPCDVVAHSYGGVLALRLARRVPERIARMVLIEPVLFAALRGEEGHAPAVAAELAKLYDDAEFLADDFGGTEPWMQRFFDYWWGTGAWARLPDTHRRASLRSAWKIFREVKSISGGMPGAAPEPFATYAQLPHAITMIRGSETTACASAVATRFHEVRPATCLHTIEGAGHMSPMTHGSAVGALLGAALC